MDDLNTYKRRLAEKIEEARSYNESYKNRTMSPDEKQNWETMMDEVRSLRNQLENAERDQEIADRGLVNVSAGGNSTSNGQARTMRSLFRGGSVINGKFNTFGDFLSAINSQRHDPRLEELRTASSIQGNLGGFAIPTEHGDWLADKSLEDEIIRNRATVHAMQSSSKVIPAWDSLNKLGDDCYGGFQAVWIEQLGTNIPQTARMREMTLSTNKLALYSDVSNELLYSAPAYEENLGGALIKSIGHALDTSFIRGDGIGKPLGLANDPALLTVARTGFPSGAPGDCYVDLVEMYSRLFRRGAGSDPVWLVHPETVPQLMAMTDVNGNLLWQQSARDSIPGKIFGLTVLVSEKLPTMAEAGCIMLADLKHYMIGLRREIYLDRSQTPGWYQDFSSFRCIIRADGQGSWNEPMTRPDGAQVSWVVSLGL